MLRLPPMELQKFCEASKTEDVQNVGQIAQLPKGIKIALVSPEYYDIAHFGKKRKEIPPFGVMYLAAIAEKLGAKVDIHRVSNEKYDCDLRDYSVVGYTIPSSVVYSLIKKVRENSPVSKDAFLMSGGIHPTLYPEQVMDELKLDLIAIGEGEETFKEILANQQSRSFKNIKGIAYKKSNGETVKNKGRPLIKDLDTIPFPARHLMPTEDIVMDDRLADTKLKTSHILCSRGCPSACNFCANQEHRIRYRSGENIREELEQLKTKYGIEGFCITDDNFIVDKKKLKSICEQISPLGLKWSALSRVDTLDSELLKRLKESGCLELKLGIESGSQRMLDAMNKRTTITQIKNAVNFTHDAGIKVKAFIIHGFPSENIESTDQTIGLLDELKNKIDRISVFRFVPLPGSPAYDRDKEFGINRPENTDDVYIYNNERKWWGSDADKKELEEAYDKLTDFVDQKWKRH